MSKLVPKFKPSPGFILIDPLEKDKKSDFIQVTDNQDVPFKGHVVAVGDPTTDENGNKKLPTAKAGDFVLYSIVGTEEFKMEYKKDLRYKLVVAPFSRILGVFTK